MLDLCNGLEKQRSAEFSFGSIALPCWYSNLLILLAIDPKYCLVESDQSWLFYDWLLLSQYHQLFSLASSLLCCRLVRILYICILASCQYPSQVACLRHSMHISWLTNIIKMKDYFFALVFLAFDNIGIFLFLFLLPFSLLRTNFFLFGWKPSRLCWQLAEDFARLPAWHSICALATACIPCWQEELLQHSSSIKKKKKCEINFHLGQQLFMLGNIILNEEYEIILLKCNNA